MKMYKKKREVKFHLLIIFKVLFCTLAQSEIMLDDRPLLERESLARREKSESIEKNRDLELKQLSEFEIFHAGTLVKCLFGYQDKRRFVLCY